MKRNGAEPRRELDFSRARRGAVVKPQPGKSKISIRLDNTVLDYFRTRVEEAGGGNYQSLINEALKDYIQRESMVQTIRAAVEEQMSVAVDKLRAALKTGRKRSRDAA